MVFPNRRELNEALTGCVTGHSWSTHAFSIRSGIHHWMQPKTILSGLRVQWCTTRRHAHICTSQGSLHGSGLLASTRPVGAEQERHAPSPHNIQTHTDGTADTSGHCKPPPPEGVGTRSHSAPGGEGIRLPNNTRGVCGTGRKRPRERQEGHTHGLPVTAQGHPVNLWPSTS